MTPAFDPGPIPYGVPKILIGALGPKMNEMAAEVADGILVMPFNSGQQIPERTMPAIERGLATAGRTRDDVEIIVEVIVGVGRNDEELEAARVCNILAFYGSMPAYKRCSTPTDGASCNGSQPALEAGDWARWPLITTR